MTKRSGARLAAGVLLVLSFLGGAAAPASALDTGWNGTKITKDGKAQTLRDTGWNGT